MEQSSFAQLWFPGVHTDVGGGTLRSISLYAFIWMVSKIQARSLLDLNESLIDDISKDLKKTSPWDLEIGDCHWIYPSIGRLGYRNPNMPAACSSPGWDDTKESTNFPFPEQKFHWTSAIRIDELPGYWVECRALGTSRLRKFPLSNKSKIRERGEEPVGKDAVLKEYWARKIRERREEEERNRTGTE
jgi:hypothetical protein